MMKILNKIVRSLKKINRNSHEGKLWKDNILVNIYLKELEESRKDNEGLKEDVDNVKAKLASKDETIAVNEERVIIMEDKECRASVIIPRPGHFYRGNICQCSPCADVYLCVSMVHWFCYCKYY